MKILNVLVWLLVALISIANLILHIYSNKKAGEKWLNSETCAWMIGIFASLNSAFLNFVLNFVLD